MNTWLLEATGVQERVSQEIKDFFTWNKGSAPLHVVWDTFKAYVQGIFIALKASRKKQKDLVCKNLEDRMQQMEQELKQQATKEKIQELQH